MKKKKIAIVGSHGLYASYGGWDQLVNNLAENKSDNIEYIIYNSFCTKFVKDPPEGVSVQRLIFKADGWQGFLFDFYSIILSYFNTDALLLLGAQGMPIIPFLGLFKNQKVIINIGGVEWERPKYNKLIKKYFKYCFKLCLNKSRTIIIDNEHYKTFIPTKSNCTSLVIPYGGTIDDSLEINSYLIKKYPFLTKDYFLSISRSLEDNKLDELCNIFKDSDKELVLISNFSKSEYGKNIINKYRNINNIHLIDGLYYKPELDLVRRKCLAYIHTHTLCGTAPSLVEMIVTGRPILSIDIPQNRYTLKDKGYFFKNFEDLRSHLKLNNSMEYYIPNKDLITSYSWINIVKKYESIY